MEIFDEALFSINKEKEKILTFQKAKPFINKALIEMKKTTNFVKYSQLTPEQRKYIEDVFPPTLGVEIRKKVFVAGVEIFYYEDKDTKKLSHVMAFVPKKTPAKKINFKKYMKILEQSNILNYKGEKKMNIFDSELFIENDLYGQSLEVMQEGLFKKKGPFASSIGEAKPAIMKAISDMKSESVTFVPYNQLTSEEKAIIKEIFIDSTKGAGGSVGTAKISGVDILYTQEKLSRKDGEKISNVIGFKHGKTPYIVINYRKYMEVKKEAYIVEPLYGQSLEVMQEGLFKKRAPFASNIGEAKPAIMKAISDMKAESVTFVPYNQLTSEEKAIIKEIFVDSTKGAGGSVGTLKISGVDILYTQEKLSGQKGEKISNVIGFKHGKTPYIVINYRKYMEVKNEEAYIEDLTFEPLDEDLYDLGLGESLEENFEEYDEYDLGL